MSNPIELILKLVDQASPVLERINRSVEQLGSAFSKTAAFGPALPVDDVMRLAQAIGKTYAQAEKLANELGLTGTAAAKAIAQIREFDRVKLDPTRQFQELNRELGISEQQFQKLRQASRSGGEGGGLLGALGQASVPLGAIAGFVPQVAALSFGFNQVTQSVQSLAAAARPAYEFLIGSNEKLNAQLLSSQTNLASATRIFRNGQEITNPTEKIQASRSQLDAALRQIEKDTQNLVGVTSAQVNELFQITLQNAAALNNQSKQFPGPIQAATSLTKGWAASLKVIGLPLHQANQEINSIIKQQITQDSMLAKNLSITNEQVAKWKSQGVLVDQLNKRLETFVAGNAIAARSIEGISSNLQDVFEIIGREAGKPLLEPIIGILDAAFQYLSANRDGILSFFQGVATEALQSFQGIGQSLAPMFGAVAGLVQAAAPGFNAIFQTVLKIGEILAGVLGPVITVIGAGLTPIVQGFSIVFQVIDAIAGALVQVFRASQPIRDAISGIALAFQQVFNQIGAFWGSAIATIERFATAAIAGLQPLLSFLGTRLSKAIQGIGDFLTPVSDAFGRISAKSDDLRKGLIGMLQSLSQQIANSPIGKIINALLQQLDKMTDGSISKGVNAFNTAMNGSKDAAQGVTNQITIQGQELERLGNTFEQLEKKVNNNNRLLKEGTREQAEQVQAAASENVKLIQQQVELGAISKEQAKEQLQAIVDNNKIKFEAQQSAREAISKLNQTADQEEIDDLKQQQQKIQEQLGQGYLSQQEATKRLNELKVEEQKTLINNLNDQLQRELVQQGGFDSAKTKQLRNQIAQAQAQLGETTRKQQEENFKRALEDVDEQQKILEGKRAQGLVSEQQFNEQAYQLTLDRLDLEEEAIRQERARLSATDKEGMEALAAREAEIQKKRVDALEKFENEKVAILERAQKRALDAVKLAETQRNIETQKLLNDRTIREVEAAERNLQEKQKITQKELELEQQKLRQLEAMPKLSDPVKEEARQQRIRGSRQRTADLTLQILKGQADLEDARTRVIQDRIDQALKATINNYTQEQQALSVVTQTLDFKTKAIERQNALLSAQKDLQQAISGYVDGQYKLAESLTSSETQKRRIQEEAARSRLAFLQREQAMERQSLELEIAKNNALLERERIQNKIEQSRSQAELAQAQAELEKTKADRKSTPAEIRARELAVQAAQDKLVGTQYQGLLIEEQGRQQGGLDAARRRSLLLRQELQFDQARGNLAQITLSKADDRALASEALAKARSGQGLSTEINLPKSNLPSFEQFRNRQVQQQLDRVVGQTAQTPTLTPVQGQVPQNTGAIAAGDQVTSLKQAIEQSISQGFAKIGAQPIQVTQQNTITNTFSGADVNNGNFSKKVEQTTLNVMHKALTSAKNKQSN